MTITLTLATWMIPAFITAAGLFWALVIVDDGGGFMSGIGNLFALVPALAVSSVAWALWGFLR